MNDADKKEHEKNMRLSDQLAEIYELKHEVKRLQNRLADRYAREKYTNVGLNGYYWDVERRKYVRGRR